MSGPRPSNCRKRMQDDRSAVVPRSCHVCGLGPCHYRVGIVQDVGQLGAAAENAASQAGDAYTASQPAWSPGAIAYDVAMQRQREEEAARKGAEAARMALAERKRREVEAEAVLVANLAATLTAGRWQMERGAYVSGVVESACALLAEARRQVAAATIAAAGPVEMVAPAAPVAFVSAAMIEAEAERIVASWRACHPKGWEPTPGQLLQARESARLRLADGS